MQRYDLVGGAYSAAADHAAALSVGLLVEAASDGALTYGWWSRTAARVW